MIVTADRISASWAIITLSERAMNELAALCERHGVSRHDVACIGYDVCDTPLLRFRCYDRRDGRIEVDEMAEPEMRARYRIVEKALVGELPDWWRPDLGGG
jgi:hypothetical protein